MCVDEILDPQLFHLSTLVSLTSVGLLVDVINAPSFDVQIKHCRLNRESCDISHQQSFQGIMIH